MNLTLHNNVLNLKQHKGRDLSSPNRQSAYNKNVWNTVMIFDSSEVYDFRILIQDGNLPSQGLRDICQLLEPKHTIHKVPWLCRLLTPTWILFIENLKKIIYFPEKFCLWKFLSLSDFEAEGPNKHWQLASVIQTRVCGRSAWEVLLCDMLMLQGQWVPEGTEETGGAGLLWIEPPSLGFLPIILLVQNVRVHSIAQRGREIQNTFIKNLKYI